MKKAVIPALLALLALTACPDWDEAAPVSFIRIFQDGTERTALSIETGQIVTLKAYAGSGPVSIVWENRGANSDNVEIVSTGEGPECVLRGREAGVDAALITVRAWKNGEKPLEVTLPVTVSEAVVTGVVLTGSAKVGVGETRVLEAEIVPAWADYPPGWTASPGTGSVSDPVENDGVWSVTGQAAGTAVLSCAAGGSSFDFVFTVAEPEALDSLAIYMGEAEAAGVVSIGVFEEKFLTARIEPASAYTFFTWESSSPAVTVDSAGVIKGMEANGSAVIKVSASGMEKTVNVQVANPVTGVRIRYANSDELPVSNVIWLYPDDTVHLEATLMPEGIEGDIAWSGGGGAVELSNLSGSACTVTGVIYDSFDAPPVTLMVSARNGDNGAKPASAVVLVKVLETGPIWAWDRARDADANQSLKQYGTVAGGSGSHNNGPATEENPNPQTGIPFCEENALPNTAWKLWGRGEEDIVNNMINSIAINCVPYTPSGLNMNASPAAYGGGANSVRLMIGTNDNRKTLPITTTSPGLHVPGIFDFTQYAKPIRISVDIEMIAPSGRNMMINVNNNTSTAADSLLLNFSRLLYPYLNKPRGTKETITTYMDVQDLLANPQIPQSGKDELDNASVTIVVMSQGSNIYVSGIRIEEGE